jgi:hypothetical protein
MAEQPESGVSLEDWLSRLASAVPTEREVRLTPDERTALLDLARVAAHRSVRIAAPLSTFVAGVALADVGAPTRAEAIRAIIRQLDEAASAGGLR